MLSRRDKLLLQPWEERRFKDHRSKVRSALPCIDDSAPPPRPHVALKLKKHQREQDRTKQIQNDNFSMLQRLNAIMNVNRLDNHWVKPLPNLRHKVGMFYSPGPLHGRLAARSRPDSDDDYSIVKCYACDLKKVTFNIFYIYDLKKKSTVEIRPCAPSIYLPAIYSN